MLLSWDQIIDELNASEEQIKELLNADLLTEIRIRGNRRFDSYEVDDLARKLPWQKA
jgi:hypothetical protein